MSVISWWKGHTLDKMAPRCQTNQRERLAGLPQLVINHLKMDNQKSQIRKLNMEVFDAALNFKQQKRSCGPQICITARELLTQISRQKVTTGSRIQGFDSLFCNSAYIRILSAFSLNPV